MLTLATALTLNPTLMAIPTPPLLGAQGWSTETSSPFGYAASGSPYFRLPSAFRVGGEAAEQREGGQAAEQREGGGAAGRRRSSYTAAAPMIPWQPDRPTDRPTDRPADRRDRPTDRPTDPSWR